MLEVAWSSAFRILLSQSQGSMVSDAAPGSLPVSRTVGIEPIGPTAGFLKARGVDRGTWFADAQARLRVLPVLAVESRDFDLWEFTVDLNFIF